MWRRHRRDRQVVARQDAGRASPASERRCSGVGAVRVAVGAVGIGGVGAVGIGGLRISGVSAVAVGAVGAIRIGGVRTVSVRAVGPVGVACHLAGQSVVGGLFVDVVL